MIQSVKIVTQTAIVQIRCGAHPYMFKSSRFLTKRNQIKIINLMAIIGGLFKGIVVI